jgi:hypothetical protein
VGDACAKSGELPESEEDETGGEGRAVVVAPDLVCDASIRTTDSQLFSSDRTRSRSSSFSRSRVLSVNVGTTWGVGCCFERYMLSASLSCLFSSSSSATRALSCENWAFRRSREFCAAIRLRWARASLRSSVVMSVRGRLRDGWGAGESSLSDSDGVGDGARRRAGSTNAAGMVGVESEEEAGSGGQALYFKEPGRAAEHGGDT